MIDHSSARTFHNTFLDNTLPYSHHRRSDPKRSSPPPTHISSRSSFFSSSNSYCMCSLYNNSIHSGNNKFATATAFQVVICAKGSDRSTRRSIPSSPAPVARTKKMSNSNAKAPLLVLTQQQQQQQQQQFPHRFQHPHQLSSHSQHPLLTSPSPYGSYQSYTQVLPTQYSGQQQQQQRPIQRRSPSSSSSFSNHRTNDTKHQYYHQQQQQQQFDRHYRPHRQQYSSFSNSTQSTVRRSYHTSNPATVTGRAVGSAAKAVTAETAETAAAAAGSIASAVVVSSPEDQVLVSPLPTADASTSTSTSPSGNKLSVPRPLSSSSVSYASAVALGAAARVSDAHNSDPEPSPADHCMQQQQPNQQELLLLGREAQPFHPETDSPRMNNEMSLSSLRASGVPDLDMTEFGLKESSDYDTADAEDDDKGLFGSDSNDTDSALDADADVDADVDDNPTGMDRRSKRKQSMQRLLAKNRTLKSSLAQAKADLASERHNRAVIDQIYLKIRKDLSNKIDTLRMELEQKSQEVEELRQKNTSASSYKIGYNSSPYSLTNMGGLMLHHSSLGESQDDYDEFYFGDKCEWPMSSVDHEPTLSQSSMDEQDPPILFDTKALEEDAAEKVHEAGISSLDSIEDEPVLKSERHDEEKEKKVTFLSPVEITAPISSNPVKAATQTEDDSDSDGSDDDNDEAPCTMMELMLKKDRSQSPEDDIQDAPADANETFESMAEKFLHQALCAKFTPARTILQLDDLLLKYDATVDRLVAVLSAEAMKWWECERLEAGGPSTGGWGTRAATLPETGEAVTAKVLIETRFKGIFVPLLLNYVPSHAEQLLLLNKLEHSALTSDRWTRNHVAQLMALYKFDVLEAEAIIEWWQQLKEPTGIFGHGHGLRSLSSKFVAWLEDEDDEDDEDDSDESDDDVDSEDDDEEEEEAGRGNAKGNVIVGLDSIKGQRTGEFVLGNNRNELDTLRQLDDDLREEEELMVIRSDDGIDDEADEQASTTCLLERIEETDRERRISFSTNNVIISREEAAGAAELDRCAEEGEKEQLTDEQDDLDEEEEGSSE